MILLLHKFPDSRSVSRVSITLLSWRFAYIHLYVLMSTQILSHHANITSVTFHNRRTAAWCERLHSKIHSKRLFRTPARDDGNKPHLRQRCLIEGRQISFGYIVSCRNKGNKVQHCATVDATYHTHCHCHTL